MRHSFLFDPNKSSLFYLVVFLMLSLLGIQLYQAVNGHYSIVGSVASFLGLFAAFQSWKAASEGARKTDEALHQMQQMAHETRQLVQHSSAVEEQIRGAVTTISDATRQLYKGYQPIMGAIRDFLAQAQHSEYMALMTDSAAIGTFYARHHRPALNQRELRTLTDRIHELLLERARDAREFYLATLDAETDPLDFPPPPAGNSLYHFHSAKLWQHLHPEQPLSQTEWDDHRLLHLATLRQVRETFELFADHPAQRAAGVPPHLTLPVLPLQLFIRYNAEANEPYRALVVFVGQYNLDRVDEARALETTDPELVRTFISMFESITNLDDHAGYQQLRRQCPL
ncbi:hypothetical protein SAMN02745146_2682 [Hymenobacter daecheongensis DSM 21074]|uniref:Uncharacterized protein n=1 Tax=Hymenobacter daecheongensis DSM 21074 TaxID=1121955 RepID=A0A1M6HWW9_9BACT|nr:hypothetical protein [Hymenobacter daecheongensis]SHJ26712.1 hypothetical protein SAMN02745146_2682 [Hymenobacter daecheongensis DSM 21074]